MNRLNMYKPGTHFKRGQRKRILIKAEEDYVFYRYPSSRDIKAEETHEFLIWAKDAKIKPR